MDDVARRTVPTHERFCRRWGYEYLAKVIPQEDSVWAKVDLAREALLEGFDRVLWLDADAAVMNTEFDLGTLPQEGIVLAADVNGLNSGILLIHKSPIVERFLFSVNTHYRGIYRGTITAEQQAIQRVSWTYPYTDVVKYVPQKMINSYWPDDAVPHNDGVYSEGDFILHLAGMENSRRVEIFNSVGLLG